MKRTAILQEAERIVSTDRNSQYGEPEDNFAEIAKYWTAYLGRAIYAKDVAIMMALFKIGRIITATEYKADSYVDACGYLACGAEIESKLQKK